MNRALPARWLALLALGAGCSAQFEGPAASLDGITEPVALAALPDQCAVLVANGNFDLKARGGAVVVVDVASRRVVPGAGVEIGSFPAQLRVHPDGGKGYVTVRADDSITWFDVTDAQGSPGLSCGAGPGDQCGATRRLRIRREAGNGALVTEPLGLELTCDRRAGSCDVPEGGELGLVSTWLRTGAVAYFPLDDDGVPLDLDVTGIRLTEANQRAQEATVSGVAGVSMGPDGLTGFVTSYQDDRLRRFRIEPDGPNGRMLLEEAQRVVGGTHDSRATAMRSVAMDTHGDRLFIAAVHPTLNRADPANLLVVDTPTDSDGDPDFRVTAVLPLAGVPGLLRVLPGDADASPPRADHLYAVMFGADRIAVVDALQMEVIDLIDVGRGPFDLAFITPGEGSRCATGEEGRPRREAWVTEFGTDRIAVINLDPESADHHRVIAYVQ